MQRLERWIITLILIHGILLFTSQIMIKISDIERWIEPVYHYIGVTNQDNVEDIKTILNNNLNEFFTY